MSLSNYEKCVSQLHWCMSDFAYEILYRLLSPEIIFFLEVA